jgi:hypothetical protein
MPRRRRWEYIVRRVALACLLIVATAIPVVAANLTVINSSDYVIHQLHVSPSASRNWGPDQLGKKIINRGERFTVRNIPDGTYDLKIVDEDEDECIIERVDINQDMTWTLTDTIIENCVK